MGLDVDDMTIGELSRRVDRLDTEMKAGIQAVREDIQRLQFVPAAVYASDRSGDAERVRRLEADLIEERREREAEKGTADQRAWQARLSLIMAMVGLPISLIGSILAAVIISNLVGGK